jgi:hypothetical protein
MFSLTYSTIDYQKIKSSLKKPTFFFLESPTQELLTPKVSSYSLYQMITSHNIIHEVNYKLNCRSHSDLGTLPDKKYFKISFVLLN